MTNLYFWYIVTFLLAGTCVFLMWVLRLQGKLITSLKQTGARNDVILSNFYDIKTKSDKLIDSLHAQLKHRDKVLEKLKLDLKALGIELVDIEEEEDAPIDDVYASMAESIAEKREIEVDRIRDEEMDCQMANEELIIFQEIASHIEEDCDQCNQDGPEKCEVNMELVNKNPDWVEQYDLGAVDTGKKY